MISESLSHAARRAEWLDRGADPGDPSSANAVSQLLDTSLGVVLREIEAVVRGRAGDELHAGLLDVLVAMHARWCGVFPFCK